MSKKIFHIHGGLGNQLYQIQFGILLENLAEIKPIYFRNIDSSHRHQNSSFKDFTLNSLRLNSSQVVFSDATEPRLSALKSRLARLKIVDFGTNGITISSDKTSSSSLTRTMQQLELPKRCIIKGFFQNKSFFLLAKNLDLHLTPKLRDESNWYKQLSKRIKENAMTVVHVRRGDYKLNPNWGCLGIEYYERALEVIQENDLERIVIFSDSPIETRREFEKSKLLRNIKVIVPPVGTPAAESMLLMSKASNIVLSNSTFSVWSGMISNASMILGPSTFYRRVEDFADRLLENWIKIESIWSKQ